MGLLDSRQVADGRAIETPTAGTGTDGARWLLPIRDALGSRGAPGMTDEGQQQEAVRYLDLPREPMGSRGGGYGSLIPAVGASALPQRRYEGSDPFSVLADIFASVFGGDNATQGETQFSVVPQTVNSGGGNTIMVLGVVLLAGVGIWYFYFRKQGVSE